MMSIIYIDCVLMSIRGDQVTIVTKSTGGADAIGVPIKMTALPGRYAKPGLVENFRSRRMG
jgi:hypothetical protein